MAGFMKELKEQIEKEAKLNEAIKDNLESLGYRF